MDLLTSSGRFESEVFESEDPGSSLASVLETKEERGMVRAGAREVLEMKGWKSREIRSKASGIVVIWN